MEKFTRFTIANPCHEDWNKMTPESQGRFCAACQKCVVDLTRKNPKEIQEIFEKENGDVCARMHLSQIEPNKNILAALGKIPARMLTGLRAFAVALFATFTFGVFSPAYTQGQMVVKGKMEIPRGASLSGVVKWDSGSPAAGATVKVMRDGEIIREAVTDETGNYYLNHLDEGKYEVYATHWSGETLHEKLRMKNYEHYSLNLELEDMVLLGDTVGYIPQEELPDVECPYELEPEVPVIPDGPESPAENVPDEIQGAEAEQHVSQQTVFVSPVLSVFPNPVSDLVTLRVEDFEGNELNYEVYDLEGKLVTRGEMNSEITISLAGTSKGVYIVKIFNEYFRGERRIVKE